MKANSASYTETTLEPIGVSRVMKRWSLKSALITDTSVGLSSELGVLMTQEALEEVHTYCIFRTRKLSYHSLNYSGFQVFSKNCANCHGMMGKKYDLLLDKVYEQLELSTWVA